MLSKVRRQKEKNAAEVNRWREMHGFSAMELLVVVAIIAVVTGIAVPPVMATIGAFRVRAGTASVAELIQDVRMRSVRDNAIYSMIPTTTGGANGYCVADQSGNCLSGELPIILPKSVNVIPEASAPAALTVTGYTQDATDPVSFNARGLPCVASSATVCNTLPGGSQVGFIYYFVGQPPLGAVIYRAVTVTPAGRVRIWAYTKGSWQ